MTVESDRPRILFVSYTAERTGPTNSLLLLLRHLRTRFDSSVVMPGSGAFLDSLAEEGIEAHTLPSLSKRAIPALVRLIRRERVELVYGNDASGAARNALIAAKLCRVPFVCHLRAMARPSDWRGRGFLRFTDAAVAVSEACARSHARYVSEHAMHVVYNGVELAAPEPPEELDAHEYLREQAELPADAFVMVSVGHLGVRKAQQQLVLAMERIAAKAPTARLVLVGHLDRDAEYTAETRALARSLGVDDRVRLLGFRQDVARLLRGADLCLHAAIVDPHPRAVLEAMAAGTAVVACAVDGVAETVLDGETGYLVAPGSVDGLADAALRLIENPAERAAFGSRGRERALRDFSAGTTAQRVGEIIERTLGLPSRPITGAAGTPGLEAVGSRAS